MKANKPEATYYCPIMKRWYLNQKAAQSALSRSLNAKAKVHL